MPLPSGPGYVVFFPGVSLRPCFLFVIPCVTCIHLTEFFCTLPSCIGFLRRMLCECFLTHRYQTAIFPTCLICPSWIEILRIDCTIFHSHVFPRAFVSPRHHTHQSYIHVTLSCMHPAFRTTLSYFAHQTFFTQLLSYI